MLSSSTWRNGGPGRRGSVTLHMCRAAGTSGPLLSEVQQARLMQGLPIWHSLTPHFLWEWEVPPPPQPPRSGQASPQSHHTGFGSACAKVSFASVCLIHGGLSSLAKSRCFNNCWIQK